MILYSQGYAPDFSPQSGGIRIVRTGAFFIETNIGDVEIYLSGKFKGKTGTIFKNAFKKNLLPRIYQIELRKDGYHSWKKNLEIKEKLTCEIKNALLLPKNPERQMVLEKNIQNFIVSPDKKKIAHLALDNKLEIFNLGSKNNYSILDAAKIDQIMWASDSKSLFFRAQADKKISHFIWQEDKQPPINLDEATKNLTNPFEFEWHPNDSTQIYFLGKNLKNNINYLYKIDLLGNITQAEILKNENPVRKLVLSSGVKNYEISDDGIYFLERISGLLFKTDFEGNSRQQLTLSSPPNYNEKNEYKLFVFTKRIGLKDSENTFYILNESLKTFEKIGENILEVKVSEDSKKLLYYGQNEIWVLYLDDVLIQPFKYRGDKELIGDFLSL